MKLYLSYILIFLVTFSSNAQKTISDLLKIHNTNSIPYISVQELAMPKTEAIVLDTREPKEYETSHIKDAIYVGYDFFELDSVAEKIPNKNSIIVVYCSLGIRSETIGTRLKKSGYTNVYNLYGGIFEWKNQNFSVYSFNNVETENIHTFSKEWSQWLTKGIKIYE